jgi:hypothetical protein
MKNKNQITLALTNVAKTLEDVEQVNLNLDKALGALSDPLFEITGPDSEEFNRLENSYASFYLALGTLKRDINQASKAAGSTIKCREIPPSESGFINSCLGRVEEIYATV